MGSDSVGQGLQRKSQLKINVSALGSLQPNDTQSMGVETCSTLGRESGTRHPVRRVQCDTG
jgi:hypothetical protein